jgi:hypothetical protein
MLMDWKKLFEGRFLALALSVLAAAVLVGLHDLIHTRHEILRNCPIIGHLRFFFKKIRLEIHQYFFEGDTDGRPFPRKRRAKLVPTKAERAMNFHREAVRSLAEMLAAAVMTSPTDLKPHHISRRVDDGRIVTLADLHPMLAPDALLSGDVGPMFAETWLGAQGEAFG